MVPLDVESRSEFSWMNRKEYRLVPLKGMRKAYLVERELCGPTSIPRSPTQKRHRLPRIRHDGEDEKRASRKTRRTLGSIPNLVEQGHWPSDVLEPFGPYTFSGSSCMYGSGLPAWRCVSRIHLAVRPEPYIPYDPNLFFLTIYSPSLTFHLSISLFCPIGQRYHITLKGPCIWITMFAICC